MMIDRTVVRVKHELIQAGTGRSAEASSQKPIPQVWEDPLLVIWPTTGRAAWLITYCSTCVTCGTAISQSLSGPAWCSFTWSIDVSHAKNLFDSIVGIEYNDDEYRAEVMLWRI